MNEEINKIINKLKLCNDIIGISLVGSHMRKKSNDIDMLVISNDSSIVRSFIRKIFKGYYLYVNDDSIRIVNYMDKEIGITIHNLNKLKHKINNYLDGKKIEPIYKNWNIVGWLPESFLYDLNNMKILYDKNGELQILKERLIKYPKKLKMAIINSCTEKINNLMKRMEYAKHLEFKILESEILSLNIRKAFAENEVYFSGFKNIDDKILESGICINEGK